jgi:hypothetical protein
MLSSNVADPSKISRSILTGSLAYWDGKQWQALPDEDADNSLSLMRVLIESIVAVRCEVSAMRLGMIEAGFCTEVSTRDATDNPVIMQ